MIDLRKIYIGWRVHAGAFVCALIIAGSTSYIFGLFVIPVSEELGLSRASVNTGFIAFLVGVGLISPFAGRLLDRFSARTIMSIGGFFFGLSIMIVARLHSQLLMLMLILGPISFGAAACGTLAANTVVVRWFKRRRGSALGILAISTSMGGLCFAPLVALLIENFGWRVALMTVGLLASILIPLAALALIRNHPDGTEPGYEQEIDVESTDVNQQGVGASQDNDRLWSYADLLRNRNFWLVSIGITLLFASDQAMVVSGIPHFVDSGIEMTAAAMIAAFMAMSAVGGKILVGYMADRVDLRLVFFGVAIAHIVLLLVFVLMPSYWTLVAFVIVCGVGVGGVFPVWSTLLAWLFGPKSYGTIMGLMTIPMKLTGVVSVRFVGEVHDRMGSYSMAFLVFTVFIAASMVMIAMVRPPTEIRTCDAVATT
jgi:MFS family permease